MTLNARALAARVQEEIDAERSRTPLPRDPKTGRVTTVDFIWVPNDEGSFVEYTSSQRKEITATLAAAAKLLSEKDITCTALDWCDTVHDVPTNGIAKLLPWITFTSKSESDSVLGKRPSIATAGHSASRPRVASERVRSPPPPTKQRSVPSRLPSPEREKKHPSPPAGFRGSSSRRNPGTTRAGSVDRYRPRHRSTRPSPPRYTRRSPSPQRYFAVRCRHSPPRRRSRSRSPPRRREKSPDRRMCSRSPERRRVLSGSSSSGHGSRSRTPPRFDANSATSFGQDKKPHDPIPEPPQKPAIPPAVPFPLLRAKVKEREPSRNAEDDPEYPFDDIPYPEELQHLLGLK
jgi:hypothetical protein